MGKLFGVLFCGVFAAAGIGIFFNSGLPMISGWLSAKSWEPVQAELLSHQLKRKRGDNTVTYSVIAHYRYDYLGQRFSSKRVSFSKGSDNIGSYHQDINAMLNKVANNRQPLTVWVNPKSPDQAVIDRGMRWGMLLFNSVFLFLFGGAGIGGMFLIYRFRNSGKVLPSADPDKPWTHYAEWNSSTIFSGTKVGNRVLLVMMLVWNIISWPMIFVIGEPLSKGEYAVLLVLLFPLVGSFLAWFWYKSHRAFKRTGLMPLTLNPYPASIGGQAGGVIALAKRLDGVSSTAEVTLKCIWMYQTGTGKQRKTRERVLFETSMVPSVVDTEDGLELRFCFDLDDEQPVSDPPIGLPRKAWRLSLSATTGDGLEIARDYQDIPVFATAQQSTIKDAQAYSAMSIATQKAHSSLVESVLELLPDERGHRLSYPAYRNRSMLLFFVIGLIFSGVGLAIPDFMFKVVFVFVGIVFALVGIYGFSNSLQVRIGAEGITSKRSLFGYGFKPQFVPSYSFKSFKKKVTSTSTVGNKTTTYYKITAHGTDGEKAIVAEGLAGHKEADAALTKLQSLYDER